MTDAVVAEGLVKSIRARSRPWTGWICAIPEGSVLGLLGPNGAGKTTARPGPDDPVEPGRRPGQVAGIDVLRAPGAGPAR